MAGRGHETGLVTVDFFCLTLRPLGNFFLLRQFRNQRLIVELKVNELNDTDTHFFRQIQVDGDGQQDHDAHQHIEPILSQKNNAV